ncbi:MAG: DUF3990 domain-containing protein [Clostridia bacterium]|nr:DUF3990 domain-containing protein [Clostridia bacterium]
MPEILLYHGSPCTLEEPACGFDNCHNDFGAGLYCTASEELAGEWAVNEGRDGCINRYTLDTEGLKVLDLAESRYSLLHWITLLFTCRQEECEEKKPGSAEDKRAKSWISRNTEWLKANFSLPADEYDIIKGYRADDNYFLIAEDFLRNYLPLQGLVSALHLSDCGEQIVLKSEKAFSRIIFIGTKTALHKEFFVRRENRNAIAFSRYGKIIEEFVNVYHDDEIRLNQIVAGKVSLDDPRLWIN